MTQIPFNLLKPIIDVEFIIMQTNFPTLFSMKDMVNIGLDNSIQGRFVSHGEERQLIRMWDYFLIYQRGRTDLNLSIYTEVDVRNIHRNFRHL